MSEQLIALAARCEVATAGQQHELLTAAYEALIQLPGPPLSYDRQCLFLRYLGAGAFTDAALTLVPEGYRFYVDNGTLDGGSCHGCVFYPGDGWNAPTLQGGCKDAATPALAICAAALRARASNPQSGERGNV